MRALLLLSIGLVSCSKDDSQTCSRTPAESCTDPDWTYCVDYMGSGWQSNCQMVADQYSADPCSTQNVIATCCVRDDDDDNQLAYRYRSETVTDTIGYSGASIEDHCEDQGGVLLR